MTDEPDHVFADRVLTLPERYVGRGDAATLDMIAKLLHEANEHQRKRGGDFELTPRVRPSRNED